VKCAFPICINHLVFSYFEIKISRDPINLIVLKYLQTFSFLLFLSKTYLNLNFPYWWEATIIDLKGLSHPP